MMSRERRTPLSEWWWTVDRLLLAGLVTLVLAGIILSLAASPPVASRIGLDSFHFFNRHVAFILPVLFVLVATSFLTPRQIRRAALVMFAVSVALLIATLLFGAEVKGSRRWISIAGISVQASEFAKPSFVILIAWLFAESARRPEMPANMMAFGLLALVGALLLLQPDFGQTMLVLMVWGALFFMAGMRMIWVFGLAGAGAGGLFLAYLFLPHVTGRIKRFMNPGSGDTFQVDMATESFSRGGWFGQGPGEGTVKRILPDSHTDFVFAVAAEEFGVIMCLVLLSLFAFIVIRSLRSAYRTDDLFTRFAVSGLALLFGAQSAINMAVNLHLIPAKGMTLPFISYGGSSMISMAYGMGMLLALTRQRSKIELESTGDSYVAARSVA
jgi:cell division protein FtsW